MASSGPLLGLIYQVYGLIGMAQRDAVKKLLVEAAKYQADGDRLDFLSEYGLSETEDLFRRNGIKGKNLREKIDKLMSLENDDESN